MLFNSLEFLILFLPVVFTLYWFVLNKNRIAQNILILVASYIFYGLWDWRFLGLIALSSLIDYFVGIKIQNSTKIQSRKFFLLISIVVNLGILCFFKYFDFFVVNFSHLTSLIGIPVSLPTLHIILPVGISFYTFQTMSYSIDVYKNRVQAEKNLLTFLCYVSFFPQLVAGPIERASTMLPQFNKPRSFSLEEGKDGARLILWGLFLKVFISSKLGEVVYPVFDRPENFSSLNLFLGQISFYVQLYCDFAGYSYIALGLGKLFGFKLSNNFNYPLFASTWREFWAKWHITLTIWFRDYFLMPLLRIRRSKNWQFFVILANLSLIGFWHGANWTCILPFELISLYYLPKIYFNKSVNFKSLKFFQILGLQLIVSTHVVLFRSGSLRHALNFYKNEFILFRDTSETVDWVVPLSLILILLVVEYFSKEKPHPLYKLKLHFTVRWPLYMLLVFLVLDTLEQTTPFIYFQF